MATDTESLIELAPDQLEKLEGAMLREGTIKVECPVVHGFAPGIYVRECMIPAGTLAIGHSHRTEHLNMMLKGRMSLLMDGKVKQIGAPLVFMSSPGTRKVAYVHEDALFLTIHPTSETDIPKLEELLIEKSDTFNLHQATLEAEALKSALIQPQTGES